MEKELIKAKRKARKLALQALYQWHMSGDEVYEVEAQFRAMNKVGEKVDSTYFCRLLHEVPKNLDALQEKLQPYLDRPIQELNPIELTVLRMGAYELLFCLEIPYRVVLDEAIVLAKEFGSQDGYRYVNGVLHALAKEARPYE